MTLAECCFDTALGVDVGSAAGGGATPASPTSPTLFGESASRVVVSVAPGQVAELLALAASAGVPGAVDRPGRWRSRSDARSAGRLVIDESVTTPSGSGRTAIEPLFRAQRAIA